jgi:hypothetical protein
MARKPPGLSIQMARQFVKDTRAFNSKPNAIKRDEIAAQQLDALRQYDSIDYDFLICIGSATPHYPAPRN